MLNKMYENRLEGIDRLQIGIVGLPTVNPRLVIQCLQEMQKSTKSLDGDSFSNEELVSICFF